MPEVPAQPQPLPDQPGTIIDGKYALLQQLGRGGMATVWRALTYGAHGVRRDVALKRIHEEFNDYPEVIEMFVEEARVWSRLRHPNIVQIHDFGLDESNRYYLVTEWVDGPHFGDYLKSFQALQRRAPWHFVTAIGIEMLRALAVAHTAVDDKGQSIAVLHRDVSPPNILLDVIGVAKLADFGLARAMDRGRITRPDMVKGKLSYLAPEMVRGEDPTPQTDLYSLAIVLWEAYSGERLFDAPTDIEVLNKVRDGRVPLLSSRCPELPLGVTTALHRALEKDPGRRFSSADEMLDELRAVLRVHPEPTSGRRLAQNIRAARARLRGSER